MADAEFNYIEQFFRSKAIVKQASTHVCNGDDASVHHLESDEELVVSTDTAVAGVHWPHDFPLVQAAERAVCAALSDLAAMGAEARWAWVSVMSDSKEGLHDMGEGVANALNRYQVELAGGDTVYAPIYALNITVAGVVKKGAAMQRDKASVGDRIWLVGKLGFASLGLKQWQEGEKNGDLVTFFSDIQPKLDQGTRLRELGVSSCIDVSDGLLQDAGHIASASKVGMQFELSRFPEWQSMVECVGVESATKAMLSGGEDYALLLTAPAELSCLESFADCIGEVNDSLEMTVLLDGQQVTYTHVGYEHFAS